MTRSLLAAFVAVSVSCGELATSGTAASYLVIDSIDAAQGSSPGSFAGQLQSDVVTSVDGSPRLLPDFGRVNLTLALKDPGSLLAPVPPSLTNAITLTRYRVRYVRADGRNLPGLDVPYTFDGALTVTVGASASTTFSLVRAQAKAEAPLAALVNSRLVISTIAEITFYGRDQTGRGVATSAWIDVHFGDWPDPK
jgi:hypothetical protein